MALVDLIDLPETGPLIGIDPGSKTLGIAACDALRLIASPVKTINRSKLSVDLDALFDEFDTRAAVGLVIGLPLNMDATEGPRAQSARAFARNVLNFRDIPVALQDERMSSAQAERAMLEADLSRARRAELIDASAAAVILQTAIDRLANSSG
ncbi:MAG: Holliday junction resolvase RuvX [Pseudomonadota bacterium]